MKNLLKAASILSVAVLSACATVSSDGDDPSKDYAWAQATVEAAEPGNLSGITPYGKFQRYTYFSRTAGRDTNLNVLLPPDYSKDKEYPVVYILHGYTDDETWMARDVVGIPQMLTQLYADGKAKEMIVVLTYNFTNKEHARVNGLDIMTAIKGYDDFIDDMVTDVMPFVEKTFSVKKGRKNAAITGFSMGGRESMFIAFRHPELFGYVGAVAPAPGLVPVPNSPMHPGQMKPEEMKFPAEYTPKFFLLSAGGNDNAVRNTPSDYSKILTDNGMDHIFNLTPGTGHDPSSVKPHLYKFFQIVFQ